MLQRNTCGKAIYTKVLNVQGKQKKIVIVNDNLSNINGDFDIFVCSAYKNDYLPLPRTVIGALYDMGIDVGKLSCAPEINIKDFGVWISRETNNANFKRICCVEILDYNNLYNQKYAVDIILKKTFSTLKYAIEQASIMGMSTKRIILPILGAGSQGIELSYIIPPLINQIMAILNSFDVEEITFFEINETKANLLKKYLQESLDNRNETDVFISYSSKQIKNAYQIANILKENNITYWMAPDSILPAEDYLDVIPNALSNTKVILLLLTPEAESSNWVSKEVATAIGANKEVVPCQLFAYDISTKFRFLLDGCQIFACYSNENYMKELIRIINAKISNV